MRGIRVACVGHERCGDKHDEDNLQNNGALLIIGIGPVHHQIYGFRKNDTVETRGETSRYTDFEKKIKK